MRRLRSRARRLTDVGRDFAHVTRALATASWEHVLNRSGYRVRPSDCAPVPVLLLPGVLEPSTYLAPLGRFMASRGHRVHVVEALGWNVGTIDDSVEHCLRVLLAEKAHGAVVIAHSKGGLTGKALLMDPRVGDAAIGMVTVATPFGGSTAGGRFQRLPPVRRSPLGLFSPDNLDLARLARERTANRRIVSLAPAWDQVIPEGSRLDGATNVTLTTGGHFRPVSDPSVWELIHQHVHRLADRETTAGDDV